MATYIFDFDGTLADSFSLVCDIVMQEASILKCKQLEAHEIALLSNMEAKQVLSYLRIPIWRRMTFIRKLRQLTAQRIHDMRLFSEWPLILKQLVKKKHQLGIISSNSHQTVTAVLNQYNIAHLFSFIDCDNTLSSKKRCLSKAIRQQKLNPKETYYIGDEVRDIQAAQSNNIHAVAVTWGFNTAAKLKQYHPLQLMTNFEQLKTFFGLK